MNWRKPEPGIFPKEKRYYNARIAGQPTVYYWDGKTLVDTEGFMVRNLDCVVLLDESAPVDDGVEELEVYKRASRLHSREIHQLEFENALLKKRVEELELECDNSNVLIEYAESALKKLASSIDDKTVQNDKGWGTELVECCICAQKWQAVYPVGVEELECPNCGRMTTIK